MVPSVVWFQCAFCSKSIFRVVPFTFMISRCCFAPMCSPLKFFWVVPFTFHDSLCCLDSQCFRLKSIFWVISVLFLWFPVLFGFKVINLFVVTSVVKINGKVSKDFLTVISVRFSQHNNERIESIPSHDTQIYWSRYEFWEICAWHSPHTFFCTKSKLDQYLRVSYSIHPILYQYKRCNVHTESLFSQHKPCVE